MFVINGAHASVIPLIAPLCAHVGHSKRQLYGKGRESSILDVNAGYIHCTNNQYTRPLQHVMARAKQGEAAENVMSMGKNHCRTVYFKQLCFCSLV